jgi:hypothetical protein
MVIAIVPRNPAKRAVLTSFRLARLRYRIMNEALLVIAWSRFCTGFITVGRSVVTVQRLQPCVVLRRVQVKGAAAKRYTAHILTRIENLPLGPFPVGQVQQT